MLHFIMTGSTPIINMCERKINYYLEKMPDGKFMNLHNDNIDHCCGIALLSSGKVVALYPVCTLNPLLYDREAELLKLSTYAVSNFTRRASQTWKEAVEDHNAICDEYHSVHDIIFAYYIFDQYEDQPKDEDELVTTNNNKN